jgi:chromosome segregation ATPase
VASAKADLAEARAQTDALSVQLDAERRGRVADADAHKAAIAALDVKVANHAEALRRVAVDLKTQMEETKAAKAETETAKARIKELEEALATAKASAQAAFEGNKLTDHDKRKLEARTTEMAREVEEAKRKAEEAREEMFQVRQLRDDAELHSADLEIQIVDLKSALDTTRADLTSALEAARKELATAHAKIAELAAQVEELRTSGGRNNAELQLLEGRLDAVTRERDRALSALTDASRKLMELEDERQQAS